MSVDMRYAQLSIGCLSRNKFWGEPVDRACRAAVCSSTVVELTDESFLLIDPGLPYESMKEALFNRRGISIDKIGAVFLTHFHGDHAVDIERYGHCRVYASPEEIAASKTPMPVEVVPLEAQLAGISPVPLPGHTMGACGLAFKSNGFRVLAAGDAVMTADFFMACEGYFNTVDEEAAKKSIRYAAANFDIIIPGHDVQFFIK